MSSLVTESVRASILNVWGQSLSTERAHGSEWYHGRHDWCSALARKYGTSDEVVAGLFSALSPQTRLGPNQDSVVTHLEAWYTSQIMPRSGTLYEANDAKAWRIITGQVSPSEAFRENTKTWAFFHNLLEDSVQAITIDTWILKACGLGNLQRGLTVAQYRRLSDVLIETHASLDSMMSLPMWQATLWITIQRLNGVTWKDWYK